jgi:hypothetical protein
MKHNTKNIEILINYLKTKQSFNAKKLIQLFKVTNNMPMLLCKAGYLKNEGKGNYVATNVINQLTTDIYIKLVKEYYKTANKKETQPQLSFKLSSTDNAKELATAIYNVIKPYL